MSMFKNAICATLTTGGIAMLCDLPNAWSATLAAGAFVATYAIPPFFQELKNLASQAKTGLSKGRQRSGELARESLKRGSELAWACSPTNPDSNVPLGASVGLAASNVILQLNEVDSHRNALVATATFFGGIAGHYLPKMLFSKPAAANTDSKETSEKSKHRSNRGTDEAAASSSVASVPSTPTGQEAAQTDGDSKKKRGGIRGLLGGQ
ncbi:MAG: hypothetical protein AB7I18_11375 [Candidatus Berkiella sp.]